MHSEMSQKTRKEVLVRPRRSDAKAGRKFKQRLLDQAVELLGYHRKAAIRALRAKPTIGSTVTVLMGRPKEFHPERLLPVLKPI